MVVGPRPSRHSSRSGFALQWFTTHQPKSHSDWTTKRVPLTYAILTKSNDSGDAILSWYGVTKKV